MKYFCIAIIKDEKISSFLIEPWYKQIGHCMNGSVSMFPKYAYKFDLEEAQHVLSNPLLSVELIGGRNISEAIEYIKETFDKTEADDILKVVEQIHKEDKNDKTTKILEYLYKNNKVKDFLMTSGWSVKAIEVEETKGIKFKIGSQEQNTSDVEDLSHPKQFTIISQNIYRTHTCGELREEDGNKTD